MNDLPQMCLDECSAQEIGIKPGMTVAEAGARYAICRASHTTWEDVGVAAQIFAVTIAMVTVGAKLGLFGPVGGAR